MKPSDVPKLRKIVLNLSISLQTGIDYLSSLSVLELLELAKEVHEVVDERKRVQTRNQNKR
jgi:hypothetical protein